MDEDDIDKQVRRALLELIIVSAILLLLFLAGYVFLGEIFK